MKLKGRRKFIQQSALVVASLAFPYSNNFDFLDSKRKFKLSLNPGAIGVNLSQLQLVETAAELGFEAIVPLTAEIATMSVSQIDSLLGKMAGLELTWDAAALPVDFRNDEVVFIQDLLRLPEVGAALKNVGVNRMSTWIMPTHETYTYRKNFEVHARRVRQMATILADYGIKLGLEYVGPKTLMSAQRYSFIRSMKELQELLKEVNMPNVGIQLDSFHWFCAGETVEDILNLDKDLIVTCDLNDAKTGRTADEQLDWERELPGHSGVIDLAAFLKALVKIGYDGPIRAEPFNESLNKMDDDLALRATFNAMKKSFELL
jgi:sugar phosphate isomerase/epimerase